MSASVTMAMVTVADYLLFQGILALSQSDVAAGSPLALTGLVLQFVPLAAGFGLGALALYITARFFGEVPLRADTMWALNGCLIPLLYVKRFLPVPGVLIYPGFATIMMMVLGVFFTGKRFWR